METKQTAVDFLKEKFIMLQWMLVRDEISRAKADELLNEWCDKAKQMEKQLIGDWVQTHWYEEIKGKNYKLYYNKNNEK